MNLQQLKVFVTVAECEKMSSAAQQLFLTESAISQTITKLEKYYNIRVFERFNKRIHITPEGEGLLFYAKQILEYSESMDDYVKQLSTSKHLNIGTCSSSGYQVMNIIVARLNAAKPELRTTLSLYSHSYTFKQIRCNKLDIALVGNKNVAGADDFVILPVFSDECVMICGRLHPFYGRTSVEPAELEGQPFVVREKYSGDRSSVDAFLAENGVTVDVRGECNNSESAKYAAEYNAYLTYASRRLCDEELQSGALWLVPVRGAKLVRDQYLLYHKSKFVTPQMQDFIDLCFAFSASEGSSPLEGAEKNA